MNQNEKITKIRDEIESAKSELQQFKGKKNAILERLESETGIKDLEKAKERLNEIEENLEKKENQFKEKLEELEKNFEI